MDLTTACRDALDLTERMLAALEAGDQAAAQDLLPARGEALAAFEASHRAAGAAEIEAAGPDVDRLADADARLRQAAESGLADLDRDVRRSRGSTPQQRGSYDQPPAQACVDRRA